MKKYLLLTFLLFVPFFVNAQQTLEFNIADLLLEEKSQQIPELYITDLLIEKTDYQLGETIKGSFTLHNFSDFDVNDVYYYLSIGEISETQTHVLVEDDSSRSLGPYFLEANSKKVLHFQYSPQITIEGDLGLQLKIQSKNSLLLSRNAIPINLQGENSRLLRGYFQIEETSYSLDSGPTAPENEEIYLVIDTASFKEDEVFDLKIYEKNFLNPPIEISKVTLEYLENIGEFGIKLPKNLKPKVYVGLLSGDNTSTLKFKYVISGVQAEILNITSSQKTIKKGEKIDLNIRYAGGPTNYVYQNSNFIPDEIRFDIEIKNESGDLVSSISEVRTTPKEILENSGALSIFEEMFSSEANLDANRLGFNVKIYDNSNNELLDVYSIKFPFFPSTIKSENNIENDISHFPWKTIIIGLILLIVLLVFIKIFKINKKIPVVGLIIIFSSVAVAGLLFYKADDALALYLSSGDTDNGTLTLNSPEHSTQKSYCTGATTAVTGTYSIKAWANNVIVWLHISVLKNDLPWWNPPSPIQDNHLEGMTTMKFPEGNAVTLSLPFSFNITMPPTPGTYKYVIAGRYVTNSHGLSGIKVWIQDVKVVDCTPVTSTVSCTNDFEFLGRNPKVGEEVTFTGKYTTSPTKSDYQNLTYSWYDLDVSSTWFTSPEIDKNKYKKTFNSAGYTSGIRVRGGTDNYPVATRICSIYVDEAEMPETPDMTCSPNKENPVVGEEVTFTASIQNPEDPNDLRFYWPNTPRGESAGSTYTSVVVEGENIVSVSGASGIYSYGPINCSVTATSTPVENNLSASCLSSNNNNTATFSVIATGGSGSYSYVWSDDDLSGSTTTKTYYSADTYTPYVTVTDSDGLTATANCFITITDDDIPPSCNLALKTVTEEIDSFTPNLCTPGDVDSFTGTDKDNDGNEDNWTWNCTKTGVDDDACSADLDTSSNTIQFDFSMRPDIEGSCVIQITNDVNAENGQTCTLSGPNSLSISGIVSATSVSEYDSAALPVGLYTLTCGEESSPIIKTATCRTNPVHIVN